MFEPIDWDHHAAFQLGIIVNRLNLDWEFTETSIKISGHEISTTDELNSFRTGLETAYSHLTKPTHHPLTIAMFRNQEGV